MIAAIYARKSTDQNIGDDEKSATRQVQRAVLDEARRQRLEAAGRAHERARDSLAQNAAQRRN